VAEDDLTALVIDDAADKMAKAVEHARAEFAGVRTGRATSTLVEKLIVDYYGSEVPMQQLAGFSVPEARLLVIAPFDKGSMPAIEKAIQESDRNLRRGGRDELKALEKDGDMSVDDLRSGEKELDDQTHLHEAQIDEALQAKERELLDD
jgi:ribosome recycling factor